ncbi:MAG: putative monooxygenase [Caulobacter sp.]|nr:putative monooxygenase [Caulobacter sp.]
MTQVLIAGAGATGMTLAIELLRRNIAVRLVDSASGPFPGSRGKGVQPRSLEIFDLIGIADQMVAASSLYPFMKVHFGPFGFKTGSLGTHHPSSEARPYPNMLMIPQWRTEEILRAHLIKLGGRIEYDAGLAAVEQSGEGVTATLTSGEGIKAEYLIGCDGGRSATRKAVGLELGGRTLDGKTMIVADLEIENLDRTYWHVWPRTRGGPSSLCPLPNTDLFQLQSPEAIAENGLEKGILRATGKRVRRVAWQSRFHHQIRMVDRYRVGRVLLAGDAAHIHPPSGAQGLNTGIQDAWNLGWKLAWAVRAGNGDVLDSYEQERLPVAAAMLDLTKTLHVQASRERGDLTNQLALNYRDSPLSKGEPSGGIFPGDRVADRRLADGRRLFDLLRHTGATQLMRRDRRHVLVRPDGYVAQITDTKVMEYAGEAVRHVDVDH